MKPLGEIILGLLLAFAAFWIGWVARGLDLVDYADHLEYNKPAHHDE